MKYITYCFIILSVLWTQTLAAESTMILKPFTTDGCSWFPDGTFENHQLWRECCIEHDKAYWRGGTYKERQAADQQLAECVASNGKPNLGTLMQAGVRVGGSPFWPTPFRWGYGWPYLRGYQALTAEELAAVNALAYSLEPAFYLAGLDRQLKNKDNPVLTLAFTELAKNFTEYQVALVSVDKGQEYSDIMDVYWGKDEIVIKFEYQGGTRLTLTHFDKTNSIAQGSYPISLPVIGTSLVDVMLKFNQDGTAGGYWTNMGFENGFSIIKKKAPVSLTTALNQLVKNPDQYQIVLTNVDDEQEHCDIRDIYRGKQDVVINFKYRGETRLILTNFNETNATAWGSYPIQLPILGSSTVRVELKFNADGTASGFWTNMGFEDQFNIINKISLPKR